MRCPVCALEESIIAHTGVHVLGDEEIFQRTRVCLACGLTFGETSPHGAWTSSETKLRACAKESELEQEELVILADSLQRSRDPLAMLAAARTMLAGGGALFVRVPDLASLTCEGPDDAFTPEERVWFTLDTLRSTLAHAGFRVTHAETAGHELRATAVPGPVQRIPRSPAEPAHSLALVERYSRELAQHRRARDTHDCRDFSTSAPAAMNMPTTLTTEPQSARAWPSIAPSPAMRTSIVGP
jgi:hypothetical protein